MTEHIETIPALTRFTVKQLFSDSKKVAETNKREREMLKSIFTEIISRPDFRALEFNVKYGSHGKHYFSHSTRSGVAFQFSFADDYGPAGHRDISGMDDKYSFDEIYQELWGAAVETGLTIRYLTA